MQKQLKNPFPVTAYHGASYFCDREDETGRLRDALENGNSVTLMAIRRIGKTGLIHHTLSRLSNNWKGIYVDILETENLHDFLNVLATSVVNSIPGKSNLGKKMWDLFKSLRSTISFDNLTGIPHVSFDIKPKEVETNIDSLLAFLEKQDVKTVIAIDEFQQILNYPEKNTDAWLRSRMQQLRNIVFIFSGSQQHLMSELFTSPARPFYRSTHLMKLGKISKEEYGKFIVSQFRKHDKEIDIAIVEEILEWTNVHTFYVQQVCNRLFAATEKKVSLDKLKDQLHILLKEQESLFFTYRNMLTGQQWNLLKAIAREGIVSQPTSSMFILKYNLNSSAGALRSLKTLMNYELIYSDHNENGVLYYSVYDVYLQRWAESRFNF